MTNNYYLVTVRTKAVVVTVGLYDFYKLYNYCSTFENKY